MNEEDRLYQEYSKDKNLTIYEALVKELEKHGRALCFKQIPDHEQEHDQIISGVIWRTLEEGAFKGRSLFSTWFQRSVVNACNDFLRSLDRRRLSELSLSEVIPVDPNNLERSVINKEIWHKLLDTLSKEERVILYMRLSGESHETIATRLKSTTESIRVRWSNLRNKITSEVSFA
jgi:RNA polymerase sigma factor (sigma-70 family)